MMNSNIKTVFVIAAFIGLIASNVLTLVDNRFHVALHDWFSATFGRIVNMDNSTVNHTRALQRSSENLLAEKQRLVDRLLMVTATVVAVQAAHEILQAKTQLLTNAHYALVRSASKLSSTVRRVAARVAPRVVIGILRNVSSLPGRLVPVSGGALSIAITGYDVLSACQTLQDVNILNEEIGDAK